MKANWHFETYSKNTGWGKRRHYFRGVGENHEIIFPSEGYNTAEARDERIASIKAGAATAEVRPGKARARTPVVKRSEPSHASNIGDPRPTSR